MGNQTLSTTDDWHKYSLYHMIEIIGYPKLHPTEAGNEAEDTVRKFIGLANKAMQKYEHLKCRVCGHLLFPSKVAATIVITASPVSIQLAQSGVKKCI